MEKTFEQYQEEMKEEKLFSTDYVIWNKANDNLVCFADGQVVIFGDKEEAKNNCYGNEYVVSCTDLPKYHQDTIIKQLKS